MLLELKKQDATDKYGACPVHPVASAHPPLLSPPLHVKTVRTVKYISTEPAGFFDVCEQNNYVGK